MTSAPLNALEHIKRRNGLLRSINLKSGQQGTRHQSLLTLTQLHLLNVASAYFKEMCYGFKKLR